MENPIQENVQPQNLDPAAIIVVEVEADYIFFNSAEKFCLQYDYHFMCYLVKTNEMNIPLTSCESKELCRMILNQIIAHRLHGKITKSEFRFLALKYFFIQKSREVIIMMALMVNYTYRVYTNSHSTLKSYGIIGSTLDMVEVPQNEDESTNYENGLVLFKKFVVFHNNWISNISDISFFYMFFL